MVARLLILAVWGAFATSCTPTFDWREVRPAQTRVLLLFPCKPASHARSVHLGSRDVEMVMLACKTGGGTFSLTYADVGEMSRVEAALIALQAAATTNVRGTAVAADDLR